MQSTQTGFGYRRHGRGAALCALKRACALAGVALLGTAPAGAQYVGQAVKPKAPDLRAVAVLEWIGDEQHPTRSRIIPITVFDGQQLQDGEIYMARPQPLALDDEVEYQLKKDGRNTGMFVVVSSAQEQGWWVGYGKWQALAKPKPPAPLRGKKVDVDDADSDQPVLHRKHHGGDSGSNGGSSAPPPDPNRPTLHRDDSGDSTASDSGSAPAPDPDRPTLHGSTDADDSSTANAGSSDPDRPKLIKNNPGDEAPSVSSIAVSPDPDRPRLVEGKSDYAGVPVVPSLIGLPPEMHQAVAVSDARNTPEHPWDYSWANPDDELKYKSELEDLARTAMGLNPPPAPAPATKSKAKTTAHKSAKASAPPAPAAPAPLEDEQFRVLELAYDTGPTMVLSAHSEGTGAAEKFVTLVAQPDLYGNVIVLLKNVTDGAHLDDTPRMHLIDAVDAMADNRGELLFELRGQTQRQFALYRVLRGQITRLFVSSGAGLSEASN